MLVNFRRETMKGSRYARNDSPVDLPPPCKNQLCLECRAREQELGSLIKIPAPAERNLLRELRRLSLN